MKPISRLGGQFAEVNRHAGAHRRTVVDRYTTPLAGDAGIVTTAATERDPLEALDDLMAVIEGLCPQWPPRGVFVGKCIL